MPEQVDGMTVHEVLPEPTVQIAMPFIERALMGERVSFDREETIGEQVRYLHATYTPDLASDGSVPGFYITAVDITARKIAELTLQHQSDHDALTGLLNRSGLKVRLAQAVARAMRKSQPLALFFIDLDHFKEVNDTLGHAAGDELLQMTAQRLIGLVRTNDTVARLGGDEFLVVLEDLQNPDEDVAAIASKIIDAIVQPFALAQGTAQVSVSIGIAIDRIVDGNTEALMNRADNAMYKAKEQGRNRFAIAD
ncbi:MAG: GGDEF domain-containing protein [Natronospirillum sp.]